MKKESVWDYPRPPKVERVNQEVRVILYGRELAKSTNAVRILETSHPPVYYIPKEDIAMDALSLNTFTKMCEFKGTASYWDYVNNQERIENIAWEYKKPNSSYKKLQNKLAFYPSKVDACFVGDEQVEAQEGAFYGGWITSNLVGPFKGGPGTMGW